MRFAGDRRTETSVQTEPLYPRRLDVCRTVVCPAARAIYRTTNVHPRRICTRQGCTPIRRERTQSPSVPNLRAHASRAELARTSPKSICAEFVGTRIARGIGANEPKVRQCRICGLGPRSGNRRERTQSQSVPDLRARAPQWKSARTNPKSICVELVGTRLRLDVGANQV
jgi:hypothetical protein